MNKDFASTIRYGMTLHYTSEFGEHQTWHVRAVVDRKEIIYRVWHGSNWKYYTESIQDMQKLHDSGMLTNGRKWKKK